jgi:hypothetical protein
LKGVLAERREQDRGSKGIKMGRVVKDEVTKVTSVEIQLAFLPVKINYLNITLTAT